MKSRVIPFLFVLSCTTLLFAAAPSHKLSEVDKAPKGLDDSVTATLNPAGYSITGPDGPICDIWFVKSLDVKEGFKPSLAVKYPFTPGQLIGAIRVPEKKIYTDFRGQEINSGVYTLRYGQQPEDGNHIGTSELYDFLMALPAAHDKSPKTIGGFDELASGSAKSAGSTHPAIFSLLPAEKAPKAATLEHDEDHEFWILNVATSGKEKGKAVKIPLRLVAVGRAAE